MKSSRLLIAVAFFLITIPGSPAQSQNVTLQFQSGLDPELRRVIREAAAEWERILDTRMRLVIFFRRTSGSLTNATIVETSPNLFRCRVEFARGFFETGSGRLRQNSGTLGLLPLVTLHEIGHCLGLGHRNRGGVIMQGGNRVGLAFGNAAEWDRLLGNGFISRTRRGVINFRAPRTPVAGRRSVSSSFATRLISSESIETVSAPLLLDSMTGPFCSCGF